MFFGVGVYRLVSGAGDIKLTKDGNVLLHEMVRWSLQSNDPSSPFIVSSILLWWVLPKKKTTPLFYATAIWPELYSNVSKLA